MAAATITYDQSDIGKASRSPVRSISGRARGILTGAITFTASYATGGEDISAIFDQFPGGEVVVVTEQPIAAGAQTGKFVKVDHTNKKLMAFTNASPYAEVANASNQSGSGALRFIAVGYI